MIGGYIDNSIKVEAFDFETGESVGIYSSIALCARKLYIRNPGSISSSLKYPEFRYMKRGTKSYKTDRKYTFKIVE